MRAPLSYLGALAILALAAFATPASAQSCLPGEAGALSGSDCDHVGPTEKDPEQNPYGQHFTATGGTTCTTPYSTHVDGCWYPGKVTRTISCPIGSTGSLTQTGDVQFHDWNVDHMQTVYLNDWVTTSGSCVYAASSLEFVWWNELTPNKVLPGQTMIGSFAVNGGYPPYTISLSNNPSAFTATLSGGSNTELDYNVVGTAPATPGTYAMPTVTVTDLANATIQRTFASFTVETPMSVATPSNVTISEGATYSDTTTPSSPAVAAPAISGYSVSPLTWTLNGSIPGMNLDSSGNLVGTPTTSGAYQVSYTVVDSFTPTPQSASTQSFTVTVTPAATTTILATNPARNLVSFIDSVALTDIKDISVAPHQPYSVTANPSNGLIYTLNYNDATVSIIDSATYTVTGTVPLNIPVGSHAPVFPWEIAVNPTTGNVYTVIDGITDPSDGVVKSVVYVISGTTVIKQIFVNWLAWGIAVNPATNKIYVSSANNATVTVIDGTTNTIASVIPVPGMSPGGIIIDPSTNKIYVADLYASGITSLAFSTDWIDIIDGSSDTLVGNYYQNTSGCADQGGAISPTTHMLYIVKCANQSILTIDTTSGGLGLFPHIYGYDAAVDSQGRLFLTMLNGVELVDPVAGTVTKTIPPLSGGTFYGITVLTTQ